MPSSHYYTHSICNQRVSIKSHSTYIIIHDCLTHSATFTPSKLLSRHIAPRFWNHHFKVSTKPSLLRWHSFLIRTYISTADDKLVSTNLHWLVMYMYQFYCFRTHLPLICNIQIPAPQGEILMSLGVWKIACTNSVIYLALLVSHEGRV